MATGNAAATLARATDFGSDFSGQTLEILDGATVLVSHTIGTFTASNVGGTDDDQDDGIATSSDIDDEEILLDGTPDSAIVSDGTKAYALTVGTSGADLNLTTLTYIAGETSSIDALAVNFPA